MSTTIVAAALDLDRVARRWRALLDEHAAAFVAVADGARIGFVARADFATVGRRLDGLRQAGERASGAPMLAFEAAGGAMTIRHERFDGFEAAAIDILFVAGDDALADFVRDAADPLVVMKRALRRGDVMFYALRPKHELQDLGYEDFLDSLGLAFLGACR